MRPRHENCNRSEHRLSRRRMVQGIAGAATVAGVGGLPEPVVAEALRKRAKQVLFIWLDGGISQLESWDPKPNTRFGGPFRTIPTSVKGVRFCELMPRTAQLMHHLTIVRSMSTQDNAHSSGVGRIQRGDPINRGVVYPYFGSAVAKLMGPIEKNMPPYVWIKPGSGGFKIGDGGFLGPKYGALAFGDGKAPDNLLLNDGLTPEEDEIRNELRAKLNSRFGKRRRERNVDAHSYVFDLAQKIMEREDLFDESTFTQNDLDRYGTHDLGRHMLVGRRMLEAGIRFVKVNSYGWDTHGDNFNGQASLVGKFDQAFSAIIDDLDMRGMLDDVLVIAMSEFGRTPRINGHIGRDHWPEAWSIAMAGAGLQHGKIVGETDADGVFVKSDPYDIGSMFHTWFYALGIDSLSAEYHNGTQPLPIAHDEMDPIYEALA